MNRAAMVSSLFRPVDQLEVVIPLMPVIISDGPSNSANRLVREVLAEQRMRGGFFESAASPVQGSRHVDGSFFPVVKGVSVSWATDIQPSPSGGLAAQ